MKLSSFLSFLPALALAAPTTPLAPRDPAAVPGSVSIRGVTYGGTGCPQGTLKVGVAQNGTVFGLIWDRFQASIGPGVADTDTRKNCQLNFDVLYSPGFQYQVFSSDYHGYAKLDAGVTGQVLSTYYFSGSTAQDTTSIGLTGPFDGTYTKRDEKSIVTWSSCGSEAMLNVNTQVRLDGTGTGTLTVDSANAKFTQWIYVNWRQC